MNKIILIIFASLNMLGGYSQSCDSLMQITVDSTVSVFVETLKSNTKCGTLDEFDIQYCSPYWGQFYAGRNINYTYGDFYQDYEEFKKTEIYQRYRSEIYPQFTFQRLKITSTNWQEAEAFLISNGIEADIVKDYQNYIENYSADDTYGDAWKAFKEKVPVKNKH